MHKFAVSLLFMLCATRVALCADVTFDTATSNGITSNSAYDISTQKNFIPTSQLLARTPNDTQCATNIFNTALSDAMVNIPETAPESEIQKIIYAHSKMPPRCAQLWSVRKYQTQKWMKR